MLSISRIDYGPKVSYDSTTPAWKHVKCRVYQFYLSPILTHVNEGIEVKNEVFESTILKFKHLNMIKIIPLV